MVEQVTKKCKRNGCNKTYTDAENDGTKCNFHKGPPMFHDLKKGWPCCDAVAFDWESFEKLKGCCTGAHSDEVQE